MRFAVPRFSTQEISCGFHLAREFDLGGVYTVAWNDTEKGLDEMDADIKAKRELVDRQEAMMKLEEGAEGGEEHGHGKQNNQEYAYSDGGVDSAAEETKEEDKLLEG